MHKSKQIEWVLRVGVFGEFLGHGIFALQGKAAWIGWIGELTGADPVLSAQLLTAVGVFDILVALIVLFNPIRLVLLWAIFWGFWTALVRPIVGESFWDFIERSANWAAPLALLILIGLPKKWSDLIKK